MVREVSLTSMKGHRHEIEYLVTDCNLVISMCLGGTINIWDYYSLVDEVINSRNYYSPARGIINSRDYYSWGGGGNN